MIAMVRKMGPHVRRGAPAQHVRRQSAGKTLVLPAGNTESWQQGPPSRREGETLSTTTVWGRRMGTLVRNSAPVRLARRPSVVRLCVLPEGNTTSSKETAEQVEKLSENDSLQFDYSVFVFDWL